MKAMPSRVLALASAALSAAWVGLLLALHVRCLLDGPPFPVLAKFSPYPEHLAWVDCGLRWYPFLAILALAAWGAAWYGEGRFRAVRGLAGAILLLLVITPLVAGLNPGGLVAWFLS